MSVRLDAICLCAAWCGACREYRPLFDALAQRHPEVRFAWIDIEDEADRLGEIDVENFPTLLIARNGHPVFFGPMRPTIDVLERALAGARDPRADAAIDTEIAPTLVSLIDDSRM